MIQYTVIMRIILVRHGETEHNAASIVQGHAPGRLSRRGHQQAESAARRLKKVKIDTIYSSDLHRARQTAGVIAAQLPASALVEDERLREQNFGDFEGKPVVDLLRQMSKEQKDFATFVPENGESRSEFQHRVMLFFEDARVKHADETVLIVTHYGVINVLLGSLLNHSAPLTTDWQIANGSVTILDIDKKGQASADTLNDIAHLSG